MTSTKVPLTVACEKPKRKLKTLSLQDKLKLIEELESGVKPVQLSKKYGVSRPTVSDIKKSKEKLLAYASKFDFGKEKSSVKRMRKVGDESLEDAVYKWYTQSYASGLTVRGVEIQAAAERLARHLGIEGFIASAGWLYRFRRRHNIVSHKVSGEKLRANVEAVEPLR